MSTVRNFCCRSAYLRIAFRSGKVLRIGVSFWATIRINKLRLTSKAESKAKVPQVIVPNYGEQYN